jgi:4-amino-4-deoxy-L-arabinose transferase-like glycosyltransferase
MSSPDTFGSFDTQARDAGVRAIRNAALGLLALLLGVGTLFAPRFFGVLAVLIAVALAYRWWVRRQIT